MNQYEKARQYFQISLNSAAQSSDEYGVNQTGYYEIGTAIKALEKQIPKKLKVEYTSERGVVNLYYFCPSCNSFRMESRKYCSNCGQSLDWKETFREWGQTKAVENLETILEESKSK